MIAKRGTEIQKLEKRINEIVDRIYKDFSESVGVQNIREYEENQLKAAQQMGEERLRLSNQLSKLKGQYVTLLHSFNSSVLFHRIACYQFQRTLYFLKVGTLLLGWIMSKRGIWNQELQSWKQPLLL